MRRFHIDDHRAIICDEQEVRHVAPEAGVNSHSQQKLRCDNMFHIKIEVGQQEARVSEARLIRLDDVTLFSR
jgi:hypothetical protein